MIDEIKLKIAEVKNPVTGKTFVEESREIAVEYLQERDFYKITYQRDGIDPENKRVIESEILSLLTGIVDKNKLMILTTSSGTEDIYNKKNAQKDPNQQAKLNVGHGPVAQKKRVKGVKKIIAVASGKGGVGKSTVSSNLALSLIHEGFKVGLLDADIYGPSIPKMFGVEEEKPVASNDKKIMPLEKYGLKLISFGSFIAKDDAVIWRGPMLGGVLNQFLFDVMWDDLDFLIIDLPPGTGDVQLSLVQNTEIDGAIIVSTPQDVALLDAERGLNMFKKVNVPVLGLIENMSYFICDSCEKKHYIFGEGGVRKKAQQLGIPLLGEIPLEEKVRALSDSGSPIMSNSELSKTMSAKAFTNVGKSLLSVVDGKKKGFFSRLFT